VLVAFVRKRDPRYIPNSQTEADRQKILRKAAAAQAARSRAKNQRKFEDHVVPEWAKTQGEGEGMEGGFESDSEEEVETIECVVCGKVFKSEKQYEAHETSKKHIKAVQELQREMRMENEQLNLDKEVESEPEPAGDLGATVEGFDKLDTKTKGATAEDDISLKAEKFENPAPKAQDGDAPPDTTKPPKVNGQREEEAVTESQDDEYAPREAVENRISPQLDIDPDSTPAASDGDITKPKIGKAKLKKAKKAAKLEQAGQDSQFKCVTCNETFPSKNKLYDHIKEENHAQPVPVAKSAAKASKGKGKKR
jgi:DnaJ family protein A protein 5